MAKTHHAANGQFCAPDYAKVVIKNGERFKVVRQHRRVKQRVAELNKRVANLAERGRWQTIASAVDALIAERK